MPGFGFISPSDYYELTSNKHREDKDEEFNKGIIRKTDWSTGRPEMEKQFRLILAESKNGYVMHHQNKDDGMRYWGHYLHCDQQEAEEQFEEYVTSHNNNWPPGSISHVGPVLPAGE